VIAAPDCPVPESVALSEPPGVAITVSEVWRAPVDDGLKRTVTLQLPPGARVMPMQVSAVIVKSADDPRAAAPIVPEVAPPVFETVKSKVALCAPTVSPPKSCEVGPIASEAAASPLPDRLLVVMPPGAPLTVSMPLAAPVAVG